MFCSRGTCLGKCDQAQVWLGKEKCDQAQVWLGKEKCDQAQVWLGKEGVTR